jgi:hypothetical protein
MEAPSTTNVDQTNRQGLANLELYIANELYGKNEKSELFPTDVQHCVTGDDGLVNQTIGTLIASLLLKC